MKTKKQRLNEAKKQALHPSKIISSKHPILYLLELSDEQWASRHKAFVNNKVKQAYAEVFKELEEIDKKPTEDGNSGGNYLIIGDDDYDLIKKKFMGEK